MRQLPCGCYDDSQYAICDYHEKLELEASVDKLQARVSSLEKDKQAVQEFLERRLRELEAQVNTKQFALDLQRDRSQELEASLLYAHERLNESREENASLRKVAEAASSSGMDGFRTFRLIQALRELTQLEPVNGD